MEIRIPSSKDENINIFAKRNNQGKEDKKDRWVNINGKEINNMLDIIEDIAEEDLAQIYCSFIVSD